MPLEVSFIRLATSMDNLHRDRCQITANTHDVPAKFAAEHNKDEVLEGKFRNLGISPATKRDNLVLF